jgi:hypothetical protein
MSPTCFARGASRPCSRRSSSAAFNDSLFKQGVVLFVTYQLYSDAAREAQFSAIAQGIFILPFFLFSAPRPASSPTIMTRRG